ncbi:MAG: PQQ-binding-like beta-propeller repeat protein [Planctomycetaceae bacterium]|nr:PQQ-binding-like beta-propeller repeat protein [Planctomycetaceae bacterium]
MPRLIVTLIAVFTLPLHVSAGDWPWWRGPNFNGIAAEGEQPPTEWNDSKNMVWKAAVPGRGHSSPIVVGDKVILTTADEKAQVQSVLAYSRNTGEPLWKTDIHKGGFLAEIHKKNTHASPTAACDGEHIFVVFANSNAVSLTALDLDGNQIWQKRAGGFTPERYKFGYGPSPLIYQDMVIVSSEYEAGGFIKAFDRESGRELWEIPRRGLISFSSPVVANIGGADYLLMTGGNFVAGYNPENGRPVWRAEGGSMATCGTLVWEDDMVFASGGYPKKSTVGVQIRNGQARQAWFKAEKCYEQSMLVHDGYLYAVNDNGIAFCWEAKTGKEMWKERLRGPVSASLTLAGDNLYFSDERGTTYVFKASPDKFTPVAQNTLGNISFATPVIVDNQIFLRHADNSSGEWVETLYCIGL